MANLRGAREQFERVVERFREIEQLAAADENPGPPYPGVALQYGIELMEWIVAWYRETERRLEAGELPEPQLSS